MPADEQEETPGFTVGGFPSLMMPSPYGWVTGASITANHVWGHINMSTLMTTAYQINIDDSYYYHPRIEMRGPSYYGVERENREAQLERARLRQERVQAERERADNWRRERDEANRRARIVLYQFLTREQIECYEDEERHYIAVEGSLGTPFRVRNGSSEGNICVMSPSHPDRQMGRVCAHPRGDLPQCDMHLGQMFALQADEREFLDRANIYNGPSMCYVDDRIFDIYAEDAVRPRSFFRDFIL